MITSRFGLRRQTAISYSYDANDRLTSETTAGETTTYSYDANGNTLTKVIGTDTTTYSYDHENRLLTSSD